MAICLVVFPVLAVKAKTVEAGGLFAKKIYTDLISRMEIATGDETIPVSIWTKDIDCDESAIVKQAQNNVNIINAKIQEHKGGRDFPCRPYAYAV